MQPSTISEAQSKQRLKRSDNLTGKKYSILFTLKLVGELAYCFAPSRKQISNKIVYKI